MVADIFSHAALPQKLLFLGFIGVMLFGAGVAILQPLKASKGLAALGLACPMLGVLCAALNGFHMMQTTLRLPFEPTLKMLAPGMMEMSALVGAGALAGLIAVFARARA